MNRYTLLHKVGLIACCLLTTACQKDDPIDLTEQWTLTVDDKSDLTVEYYGHYSHFTVSQHGGHDSTLTISTDADWLRLSTERVPDDGIVKFLTEDNEGIDVRTASIRFCSAIRPERVVELTVRQLGLPLMGNNDMKDDYCVGWGFDAYQEFQSSTSVKGKVIDERALVDFDSDTTFNSYQESVRGRQSFEVFSAHSLQEMSNVLTKQVDKSVNFLFFKETTKRLQQVTNNSHDEHLYAYARLTKTVASKSMDNGVLEYLLDKGVTSIFTDEFKTLYDSIMQAQGSERVSLIKAMLNKFGTHVVTEASLGGMIDYVVTFDRQIISSLEASSEAHCGYFFGFKSKEESERINEHITSETNNKYAITIKGGKAELRDSLKSTVQNLDKGEQLNNDLLQQWNASINSAALYNEAQRSDLDIVDFKIFPIWKMFTDSEVQGTVMQLVIEKGKDSDCSFTDEELGTDNYIFTDIDQYDKFGTDEGSTLVKAVYGIEQSGKTTPLIEVCNEYVPKIRSDKRITVFYPIKDGRVRIGQGIFPGDGEGNPPAMLTFSGGDCFVNPINGYGYNKTLTTLYYLHGNLYTEDFGTPLNTLTKIYVDDQYLKFSGSNVTYPVVKIGSGYWTRCYIKEEMCFVENDLPKEQIVNGVLFANITLDNSTTFLNYNKEIYGSDVDKVTGLRSKWYMPMNKDVKNLGAYIGKNQKMLFKRQASGFEAQFLGYYGMYDDLSNNAMFQDGKMQIRYKDKCCYIASKDVKAVALYMLSDYTLNTCSQSDNNYYPVRLFRTSAYNYQH